jgi:predicted nucleic acid-binding protein
LADLSWELVEAEESRIGAEELDAGERAAIAVTEERGVVLPTDDLAAREAASDAGVEVHGSIGVIALVTPADRPIEMKRHHVCEHSSVRRVSS